MRGDLKRTNNVRMEAESGPASFAQASVQVCIRLHTLQWQSISSISQHPCNPRIWAGDDAGLELM